MVLDSGGYGAVTVTQTVTILSPAGVYAGISVFGGTDGVTVCRAGGQVVLRGLTINGQGGNNGIRVQAGEVHVENTVVSGMTQAGILVEGEPRCVSPGRCCARTWTGCGCCRRRER